MNFNQFARKHGGLKANVFPEMPLGRVLCSVAVKMNESTSNVKIKTRYGHWSARVVITSSCQCNADVKNKLGNMVTKKLSTSKIQIV